MEKKFKLLKDLPATLAGTTFVRKESNSSVYRPEKGGAWFEDLPEEIVHGSPEWFSPISEPLGGEKIEVIGIRENGISKCSFYVGLNRNIMPETFPLIKQAIESVLNPSPLPTIEEEKFVWTDELVKEVVLDMQKEGYDRITDLDLYLSSFKSLESAIRDWEILNQDSRHNIYKVIKKSDKQVFDLNEEVDFRSADSDNWGEFWVGKITAIKESFTNKNEIIFVITEPNGNVAEKYIHNIRKSAPKQNSTAEKPVTEEAWEIISFEKDGSVLTLDDKKRKYRNELNSISDIEFLKKNYQIHSVLRKSDNQLFTVGDEVEYRSAGKKDWQEVWLSKIESIEPATTGGELSFKLQSTEKEDVVKFIVNIRHPQPKPITIDSKPVLFTTEDGVEITVPTQVVYGVDDDFNLLWGHAMTGGVSGRKYSTEAAAQEYILLNKPCLSIEDIKSVYAKDRSFVGTDFLMSGLEKLAKSKL